MKFPESVPAKNFPDYDAMNDGNIRNRKTGRVLKTGYDKNGYKALTLRRDGKQHNVRVARVIADSFYEGDHSNLDICYRDSDRTNTAPDNLTFCTRSESIKRSTASRKRESESHVKVYIPELDKVFYSMRACAIFLGDERYRVNIAKCLDKHNRTFKGLHFERC